MELRYSACVMLTQRPRGAEGLAGNFPGRSRVRSWNSMTCQRFDKSSDCCFTLFSHFEEKKQLNTPECCAHILEYLEPAADILMSEVSGVLKSEILDRYFQEQGSWWITILSLMEYFIPPNAFHPGSRVLHQIWLQDFDVFAFGRLVSSLAAAVIAARACLESLMFWLHK